MQGSVIHSSELKCFTRTYLCKMLRNVYHGARLALSQWGVARRWQSNSTVTGTAESEDRFLVAL